MRKTLNSSLSKYQKKRRYLWDVQIFNILKSCELSNINNSQFFLDIEERAIELIESNGAIKPSMVGLLFQSFQRLEARGVGVTFSIFDVAINHFSENKSLYSFIDTVNLVLFGMNKVSPQLMEGIEQHLVNLASRKTIVSEERRRAHYYSLILMSILKDDKFSDSMIPLVSEKVRTAINENWLEKSRAQLIRKYFDTSNREFSQESRKSIQKILEIRC